MILVPLGLLALAAGAILAAMAIWRSGMLARYSGIPFAIDIALFLPQFFAPPAVRIGHGVCWSALDRSGLPGNCGGREVPSRR